MSYHCDWQSYAPDPDRINGGVFVVHAEGSDPMRAKCPACGTMAPMKAVPKSG